MRVTFFRHSLLSRGGDKMVCVHASYLASVGHQVTIEARRVDTVFQLDPSVHLKTLPFSGKSGTLLSAAFGRLECDRIIADIIPLVCLLALRNRGKVIYFAQDYDESYYASRFMKMLVRCMYYLALRCFRIPVIAVSANLAKLLEKRFNADVMVVENGVDTSVFYPDPDHELIIGKEGRKALLLLSRSDRRKGFDIAREVVAGMKTSHNGLFEVWTVGEPCPGMFPDTVHRDFGYLDEKDLRRVMSSADMFLYPSRHEGLPLMPLEAFACKCPLVTTEAVPFASHGENAFVAKVEDVQGILSNTVRLLGNYQLAESMVERAHATAMKQSLGIALKKFEDTLASTFVVRGLA